MSELIAWEEFWELVVILNDPEPGQRPEWLRKAFVSETAAKARAEKENEAQEFPRPTPMEWKDDHHGGYKCVGHGKMRYFVFPRIVFPQQE
jgi:hypothetical protein